MIKVHLWSTNDYNDNKRRLDYNGPWKDYQLRKQIHANNLAPTQINIQLIVEISLTTNRKWPIETVRKFQYLSSWVSIKVGFKILNVKMLLNDYQKVLTNFTINKHHKDIEKPQYKKNTEHSTTDIKPFYNHKFKKKTLQHLFAHRIRIPNSKSLALRGASVDRRSLFARY